MEQNKEGIKVGDKVLYVGDFKPYKGKILKVRSVSGATVTGEGDDAEVVSGTMWYRKLEPVTTASLISDECDALKAMLLAKNKAYGNSAIEPTRVFSKASSEEQLLVRIDDKLSRVKNAALGDSEDTILDLLGYLVLLRIARKK